MTIISKIKAFLFRLGFIESNDALKESYEVWDNLFTIKKMGPNYEVIQPGHKVNDITSVSVDITRSVVIPPIDINGSSIFRISDYIYNNSDHDKGTVTISFILDGFTKPAVDAQCEYDLSIFECRKIKSSADTDNVDHAHCYDRFYRELNFLDLKYFKREFFGIESFRNYPVVLEHISKN